MSAAVSCVPLVFTFCAGAGQHDTRVVKRSDGTANPHPLAGQPYDGVTEADIEAMVRQPPQVEKAEARWFIPSLYLASDARSHTMQRARGKFGWLPLDVDKGDRSLDDVDAALVRVLGDVRRLIYATRSSKPGDRKWRALVPLTSLVAGADYADTMSAFYDLLAEASDGKVRADHALSRPGQLVYLPNRGDAYEHRIVAGAVCVLYPSHRVIQRRESTQRALKAAEAEARVARAVKAGERPSGERSVISDFNERTPVGEMLARCGYEPSGHDWRSPNQGSGSFATRDRGDHWVSLSISDAEVGLGLRTKNGHRTGDAFDLFVHYEHNGDFTNAVRAHGDVMAGLGVGHPSAAEEFGEAVADAPATAVDDGVRVFSAASLSGLALPERRAIDKLHMIPMNVVTGFSGDGGTGKSQMAMQLGCGVAHTGSWLGIAVERGPVLYFSAEDDRAENHIRLSQIAAAEGFAIGDLVDLHLIDMAGRDAVLATEDARNGRMLETPLFKQICTHIDRIRPVLLVLDNLADVFSGNESNRTLVRQFVGMLRGIGHKFGCAVLLLSHPSLAGLTSGSGNSGSTAWHNSFRSRLYLRRELDEKGFERNSRRRVLEHKKANYAGSGMLLTLEWDAGRFTPLDGLNELDGTFDAEARTRRAERVFLDLVELHWMNKVNVSLATGPNFAPFVFADHTLSEGITKREFKAAMDALLGRGAIQIHESGPPSRRTRTIISAKEAAL